MAKYLDYAGLGYFLSKLDERFAPIQAIIFKSSVEDITQLPALNTVKPGWMYNIQTGGITTNDFIEGAGHIFADGENVACVELITGYSATSVAVTDDPKALGLYEVDNVVSYYAPGEPVSDPQAEGFFEFATATPISDPAAEGLYEADGVNFVLSTDSSIDPSKTYYNGALSSDNTVVSGKTYYELKTITTYKLTEDRIPASGKTYYEATTVNKWDLMGGLFDLEGRYLEFGEQFPKNPVDGRTFLYMGEDTQVYTLVASPSGRPADNGYFEGTFTPVADPTTIFNPKQQGLYEEILPSTTPATYVLSSDIAYDNTKTYYDGVFVASADTTVDPAKAYYTEADQYKHAVIYQYDATTEKDWVAQSASNDMIPITNNEIDDLFI